MLDLQAQPYDIVIRDLPQDHLSDLSEQGGLFTYHYAR